MEVLDTTHSFVHSHPQPQPEPTSSTQSHLLPNEILCVNEMDTFDGFDDILDSLDAIPSDDETPETQSIADNTQSCVNDETSPSGK